MAPTLAVLAVAEDLGVPVVGVGAFGIHRRARRPPRLLRMGASGSGGLNGSGLGVDAGSSFASADLSGASRGDSGNGSSASAFCATVSSAACSSSVIFVLATRMMAEAICLWCERSFSPRDTGGKPQRFCRPSCRTWFFAAARRWAVAGVLAGRIPVAVVKTGLPATCTLATASEDAPPAALA